MSAEDHIQESDDAVIGTAVRWSIVAICIIVVLVSSTVYLRYRAVPKPVSTQAELTLPTVREAPTA